MKKLRRCRTCNEKGYIQHTYETCPVCDGSGYIPENYRQVEEDDRDEEDSYY